jgi:hypothetical protein
MLGEARGPAMAIDLNEHDHELLEKFLDSVLQEFKQGKCDSAMARAVLAHAFGTMASEAAFRSYMRGMLGQEGC